MLEERRDDGRVHGIEIVQVTGVIQSVQSLFLISSPHRSPIACGMLKTAPHKEASVKFLEYLASDDAQRYFADGNNEWPVVDSVKVNNPALEALGKFRADNLPIAKLAMYQVKAQMIFDRAGFK